MTAKRKEVDFNFIKRLVVIALTSDGVFMGLLVLKGGNALELGYEITSRGSVDIDFSLEGDFTESELERMKNQASNLLNHYFNKEDLLVFDVKLENRPKKINEEVIDFWGGYLLHFKVIELHKADFDIDTLRREALVLEGNQTKFCVDISKYEYVASANKRDIGGAIIRIYSPEMLAIEKIRALCQQVEEYKSIVISMTTKSRARDFYDVYNLTEQFNINPESTENKDLTKAIFNAKKVPFGYFFKLKNYQEFHRQSWEAVTQTVGAKEKLKEFNYYFEYVINKYENLFKAL